MRASEHLRRAVLEITAVCDAKPAAANVEELAKMAGRLLALAGHVELDERSIVKCPNCDTDLPLGCSGVFRADGEACWLNRTAKNGFDGTQS